MGIKKNIEDTQSLLQKYIPILRDSISKRKVTPNAEATLSTIASDIAKISAVPFDNSTENLATFDDVASGHSFLSVSNNVYTGSCKYQTKDSWRLIKNAGLKSNTKDMIFANDKIYAITDTEIGYSTGDNTFTWVSKVSILGTKIMNKLLFKNNILLLITTEGGLYHVSISGELDKKTVPQSADFIDSVYGNKFVVVGNSPSTILYSDNATTWKTPNSYPLGSNETIQKIVYGGGRYAIYTLTENGITYLYFSTDAITWIQDTKFSGNMNIRINDIFGIDDYIICSIHSTSNGNSTSRIYSTSDGENWNFDNYFQSSIRFQTYDNGYVIASDSTSLYYLYYKNKNESNVTLIGEFDNEYELYKGAYGNEKFVLTAKNKQTGIWGLLISLNGIKWNEIILPISTTIKPNFIKFCKDRFYIEINKSIYSSTDALTWQKVEMGLSSADIMISDIDYNDYYNSYYIVYTNINTLYKPVLLKSSTGTSNSWTEVANITFTDTTDSIFGIIASISNRLILVTKKGYYINLSLANYVISTNTKFIENSTDYVAGIAVCGPENYSIAITNAGNLYRLEDSIVLGNVNVSDNDTIGFTYGNGIFLISDNNEMLITTGESSSLFEDRFPLKSSINSDGVFVNHDLQIQNIVYGNNRFVCIGNSVENENIATVIYPYKYQINLINRIKDKFQTLKFIKNINGRLTGLLENSQLIINGQYLDDNAIDAPMCVVDTMMLSEGANIVDLGMIPDKVFINIRGLASTDYKRFNDIVLTRDMNMQLSGDMCREMQLVNGARTNVEYLNGNFNENDPVEEIVATEFLHNKYVANLPYKIAYGKGMYVMIMGPSLYRSPNLTNWTIVQTSSIGNYQDVIFAYNMFVLVGNGGAIYYSEDGIDWEPPDPDFVDPLNTFNQVKYFNGKFYIIGGKNGTYLTSLDGINWISNNTGYPSDTLKVFAYGNGTIVALATTGATLISTDGATWKKITTSFVSPTYSFNDMTYGNGYFIAVAANRKILSSTDNGATWNEITMVSGHSSFFKNITYDNISKQFIIFPSANIIYTSFNGDDWVQSSITTAHTEVIFGVFKVDSRYLLCEPDCIMQVTVPPRNKIGRLTSTGFILEVDEKYAGENVLADVIAIGRMKR